MPSRSRASRLLFFLRELRNHDVRLSLRSKGRVNVASIAERFGGVVMKVPAAAPLTARSR